MGEETRIAEGEVDHYKKEDINYRKIKKKASEQKLSERSFFDML